jgi:uncharacterized protein (TIRG00374 family)
LARWQDLSTAFTSIRPINFIGATFLTFISLGTRAIAWRVLLDRKASFWQSFFIISEGYFLNNLFPLRAGELGRAIFMGQVSGLGAFHVLSTIVIERSFDLAMAAGLLVSTLPFALGVAWAESIAISTLILVMVALFVLYLGARYHQIVEGWIVKIGARYHIVQKWIVPRLGSLLDGLSTLTDPRKFLWALFWIASSWAIWVSMYYLMISPIQPGMPFFWAVFTTSVLALGIAIPQAPGGVGVYEASVVGALAIFGISPSVSLAYALMMHLMQFIVTGIFGFWGLLRDRRSLSSLFTQLPEVQKSTSSST